MLKKIEFFAVKQRCTTVVTFIRFNMTDDTRYCPTVSGGQSVLQLQTLNCSNVWCTVMVRYL